MPWRPTSRFWPTIAPFYRAGARTAVSGHGPTAESVDPRSWSASGPSAAPEPHALPILPQPLVSATQRLCVKATLALIVSMVCTLAAAQTTSRLIVKLRDSPVLMTQAATTARIERFTAAAAAAGVALTHEREMAIGAHVMALARPLDLAEARVIAARLSQNPEVEYAQPDVRRHLVRTTNDTHVGAQFYLSNTASGISANAAWDVTTGSPNVVVAVVDTGYRPHADLAGRILPGYDFVSDPAIANDGNGRDADATDPGDWVTQADLSNPIFQGQGCTVEDSSWHGTGVSGIIAANSDNGQWLAGIDWAAKILPVRVLGKCGGDDSDIIDGIAWAAGLNVPGVPPNPYPAQVINLSLGGPGDCTPLYHSVLSSALSHGITRAIVVAAGNETTDVSTSAPANCSEVIAVAATTKFGSLASYSNFGAGVALSAPGGDAPIETDGIAVLFNTGTTVPDVDTWAKGGGTSLCGADGVRGGVAGAWNRTDARREPSAGAARVDRDAVRGRQRLRHDALRRRDRQRVCGRRQGTARRARAQLPGTVVECAGRLRVGLGHQLRAPGRHDIRELVHLRHQRPRMVARDDCAENRQCLRRNALPDARPAVQRGAVRPARGDPHPDGHRHRSPSPTSTTARSAYTVNGTTQTKTITRQVFGAQPTCVWARSRISRRPPTTRTCGGRPGGLRIGLGHQFLAPGRHDLPRPGSPTT